MHLLPVFPFKFNLNKEASWVDKLNSKLKHELTKVLIWHYFLDVLGFQLRSLVCFLTDRLCYSVLIALWKINNKFCIFHVNTVFMLDLKSHLVIEGNHKDLFSHI